MANGYVPFALRETLETRRTRAVAAHEGGVGLIAPECRPGEYLFSHTLPELKMFSLEGEVLRLGAALTYAELIGNPMTPVLLKEAVSMTAAPAIRNEGTIGGNIANGSSKADGALIFVLADALLKLKSVRGERILPIRDFYLGRKKVALRQDELIVEILLPIRWLNQYYYKRIGARKTSVVSRVAFGGLMTTEDDTIRHLATAFGAVSDVIVRRSDLDAMLIGKTIRQAKRLKKEYLAAYDAAIRPARGRVSAEYRKAVCMSLLEDFLTAYGV